MPKSSSYKYVAIQWAETPPTWDVLPEKHILTNAFKEGDIVDGRFGTESSPAVVLKIFDKRHDAEVYIDSIIEERNKDLNPSNPSSEYTSHGKDVSEKDLKKIDDAKKSLKNEKLARNYSEIARQYAKQTNNEESEVEKLKLKIEEKEEEILFLKEELRKAKDVKKSLKKLPKVVSELTDLCETLRGKMQTGMDNSLQDITGQMNILSESYIEEPFLESTCAPKEMMVRIGPHTEVAEHKFHQVNFGRGTTQATKDLCMVVFGKAMLAARSLTGKLSNAHSDQNTAVKEQLCKENVDDIIAYITKKTGGSAAQIRKAISSKCNDEGKLLKRRKLMMTATTPT